MYTIKKLQRHSLLFPLSIVFFEVVLYFSNDVFLPAIPQMMHDLHLSITDAQMTVSLWFIGAAMTTLFVGVLSDHFGRRPIILIGAFLYTIASFCLIFIINKYWFLFFRFIQGSMVCFLTVPGYAAIHESYDNKAAVKMLALMGAITIIAPAFGPLLGGLIIQIAHWRYIFVILSVLGVISMGLLACYIVETLLPEKRQSLIIKDAFLSYQRVMKESGFVSYNVVLALIFSGFIAWVTLSPVLLLEHYLFTTVQFGWIQVVVFSCYIVGGRVVNHLIGKDYPQQTIILFALLITLMASVVGFVISLLTPDQFLYFLPCMMSYSFGSALCFPMLGRLAIESSREPMGRRTGLQSTILMVFASIGTMCAGWLYNGELFGLTRFIACVAALALMLYCWFTLRKSHN